MCLVPINVQVTYRKTLLDGRCGVNAEGNRTQIVNLQVGYILSPNNNNLHILARAKKKEIKNDRKKKEKKF